MGLEPIHTITPIVLRSDIMALLELPSPTGLTPSILGIVISSLSPRSSLPTIVEIKKAGCHTQKRQVGASPVCTQPHQSRQPQTKQDSLPYIGHCDILFVAAKVILMCSARANRFYFFIPKYSSITSDLTSFRKYFFKSGESSSNPSSSAQIS